MKNFIFLFAVTLFMACTQPNTSAPTADAKKMIVTGASLPDEISSDSANVAFTRWDTVQAQIKGSLSPTSPNARFLVDGFHIPIKDLQDVLATTTDTSKIFAMLAIEYGSNGQPKATIVFQAKVGNKYKFYDFSNPCPAQCPD